MASDKGKGASTTIEFKHFDIVSDVSDHHYRKSNQSGKDKQCFANAKGSVHRQIMKEWRILERDLPDSIYVRVYESRIDLLRAVIIGPSGTPYHDGLFFFDIIFPPSYPKHPPQVYYHAHGLRLNPNLYACGKVCLSLINTWSGAKPEKWTPAQSTILQLLVSIQGLVLNDQPYFNEPGNEAGKKKMTEGWLNRSNAYNETALILSCRTMLYKMHNPPKHFESFVANHFCGRAEHVLAALKAYKAGWSLVEGSSSTKSYKVSAQFKANIEKVYQDLERAFKKLANAPTPIIQNPERSENNELAPNSVAEKTTSKSRETQADGKKPKGPKHGVWNKVTGAFKWIWS